MNFSDPASEKIKAAAEKMAANPLVVATVRGSATGYSSKTFGKGRAEAVRSKFAEFGIPADRITVSGETGSSADAVSVSFRKRSENPDS